MIAGFGAVAYNITQLSFRQAICPARMLGRMNSVIRFLVWGTMPLGALLGGALGTWFGLRPALWVAAIGAFFTFLPILFSPVPKLREMPNAGRGAAAVRGRGGGRARRRRSQRRPPRPSSSSRPPGFVRPDPDRMRRVGRVEQSPA